MRRGIVVVGLGTALGVACLSVPAPRPVLLYNTSPSLPLGWYVRTWREPAVGEIIAFRVPAEGRPYVDSSPSMAFYKTHMLLKTVIAGAGSTLCRERDIQSPGTAAFSVNGVVLGTARATDGQDRDLPSWSGCQRLPAGEVAVFSDRIPNSFDSRYYGPVHATDIIGVFEAVR